jgi:hypothetical protein
MTLGRDDLRLDDLLSDALVRAVMRADHVEPEALRSLANAASSRIAARRDEDAPHRPVSRLGRRRAFGDPFSAGPAFRSACLDGF